ncbi:stage II sporulation protein R [Ferroacidibacillus organovorans]|uniref:Stage II sporulation protein R n=1 Tax=Ferroacidibacillus organovorans TaxID=1765683 RepID=A0A101XTN5_9BACL|nr:stage II sporulation protein R [Ferroacidibacillus organovorans]KUO97241.1 hypothetical protein ATW55_11640 [Ferroacidibacillus organovorans]
MRRGVIFTFVGVCLFGLLHQFSFRPLFALASLPSSPLPANAIRIRIIANSNTPHDQRVKLAIRDRVLTFLSQHLPKHLTYSQTALEIQRDISKINSLIHDDLNHMGITYNSTTTFGMTWFPRKFYGNHVFPAGNYEALRIVLGKGQGHNWWCVIFPQLCYVAMNARAIPRTGAFPQTPPLAVTSITEPNGKRIPVQLRLAIVDYGQQWLSIAELQTHLLWVHLQRTL